MNKCRIFIVDDHPVLREGLAQLISHEEDMILVGGAGNAKDSLECIKKAKPDLMIVDISLEGTSGLELTKTVLVTYPKMLILMVSMYDESVYIERVLRAGAKGYVTKREASDRIVLAIRKVMKGEIYVSDKWRERLLNNFVGRNKRTMSSLSEGLTDRELEVLQLTGQGHATSQIAQELYVSIKTIESHYANIKTKLDLKNSHELVQYAVKWSLAAK